MEADDIKAAAYDKNLRLFPAATNIRAKSAEEALGMLATEPGIQQVCIEGRVWTISQAMSMLRG